MPAHHVLNRPRLIWAAICLVASLHPGARAAEVTPVNLAESAHAVQALALWLDAPRAKRAPIWNEGFSEVPLSKTDSEQARQMLWADHASFIRSRSSAEMEAKEIEVDSMRMKFETVDFGGEGAIPAAGRSLFLSLHGGGGAPPEVNESQWRNQIQLAAAYRPSEGIYLAPRAPTNAWNLWHEAHIDKFFERIIENMIVLQGVNPNRVYLLGYSAGGDGVYQLAPRMADRWAAASMMAGHPNDASPLGLRNIGFAIHVGASDDAYNRNKIAEEWGAKLDGLEKADPGGYAHYTELHAGKGHWMDLEDKKAIPWMEKFTRNPLPDKIAWHQSPVLHSCFYWLKATEPRVGADVFAERTGEKITLRATVAGPLQVRLNDAMLDLDHPLTVTRDGKQVFSGVARRTISTLAATIDERGDPFLIFSAEIRTEGG